MRRVADAIEEHRSIMKASAKLGATQPDPTKCLQEFEEIVEARLFHRHTRCVTVPPAGVSATMRKTT
jgi:LysR family pca operon transcriptional activator